MKNRIFLFVIISSLLGSSARAEQPPISDWSQTEVVIVYGQAPGPALWHIKKDSAEVWILGTIDPLPEGLYWNEGRLKEVIAGAKQVVLPPEADVGFFSTLWFTLTQAGAMKMPDGQAFSDVLPDDLRTQFQVLRASLGDSANRYEKYKPVVVGLMLPTDYNKANNLVSKGINPTAESLAQEANVKIKPIGAYDVIPLFKDMLKKPPAAGLNCFAGALRDVEHRRVHAAAAGRAWAIGDIKTLKAHYSDSSMRSCFSDTPLGGRLEKRAVDDVMATLNDALASPGKTVMLVDIGTLLRQGGVVERLYMAGISVEGPAE